MTERFFLPVGEPDLIQTQADADTFLATLPQYEAPFGGDQVFALYRPPDGIPLPDAYKTIVAMLTGVAHHDPVTGSIRLQLKYSTVRALESTLGKELPIPTRITYGPVTANFSGSKVISAGQPLGQFEGDVFFISLQDQDHYFLDPRAYFQLFEQHNLWELPDGVRCPLVSPTDIAGPVAIAGPNPVALGQPFLTLSGGSLGWQIHNPPNPLPPRYCSFLSSDTISLSIRNLAAQQTASLRLKDVSHTMYQTRANPKYVNLAAATALNIIPQEQLKPHHESYKGPTIIKDADGKKIGEDPGNGKYSVGKPLSYELKVTLSNPAGTLIATISQDQKDIIRQEYLFHSKPFQSGNTVLAIPTRKQLERNRKPDFVKHFQPAELQRSNYDEKNGNWMLNRDEVYHVAEYMRRQFAERLATLRVAGSLSDKITSYGLAVSSSWRNPERNERVNGVRTSNHQFGRALDIRSPHFSWKNSFAEERRTLQVELFGAGYTFLDDLIQLNGGANCASVEILLERGSKLLWSYKAQSNNTIQSKIGEEYASVVGAAPADSVEAIRKAAKFASHVHIGWKSADPNAPLALPEVPAYDDIAPSPGNVFRNIILIADEDSSVDADEQLPLNHIAAALKRHLEKVDANTPTDIHVVRHALDYLQWCNAFRLPPYKIRYFFSFSHAWPGGLTLVNYDDDVPYIRTEGASGPQIHDAVLYQLINFKYADLRAREDAEFDFGAEEEDYLLKYGPDDFNEIRTHQMRVSNLCYLPQEAKEYMRQTFIDAQGIYIVGCRTADLPDVPESSFCQALANLLEKSVYGAAYFSKVFQWQLEGLDDPVPGSVYPQPKYPRWEQISLDRTDPEPPAENPVVLVPGALGGGQYLYYRVPTKLRGLGRDAPDIADFPETTDLLKVYEEMLTRCDPQLED